MEILEYYYNAKNHVLTHGYKDEVEWCEKRETFEFCTPETFYFEYVYVVLNAGMKEQIARKIYDKFCKDLDFNTIGHLGKRKAIGTAISNYNTWFDKLQNITPESLSEALGWDRYKNDTKKKTLYECLIKDLREKYTQNEIRTAYLGTLPWIGKVTKYHLARNIGIDCVKPDRHLVRLAEQFGFKKPHDMCVEIQKHTKERLGLIDVVLWRYCNLNSSGNKPAQDLSRYV